MKDELRKIRCCLIGHRPQSLKRLEDDVKVDLENGIVKTIAEGYTTFISGMTYGVDIWAAEIVIRLKQSDPKLHLIAAIPFPGFEEEWAEDWCSRYRYLLSRAEYVKVMEPNYSKEAYQRRNEWMVDHSGKVIAVCNGQTGGTRDTIRYARVCKKPVLYIPG